MKTALYVATVARTYRNAIDDYLEDPEKYRANMEYYKSEIGKCTYREFTTGFFFGKPGQDAQIYDNNTYVKNYTYIGMVDDIDEEGRIHMLQKNKFCVGDEVEVMKVNGENIYCKVLAIWGDGQPQESAPHPQQALKVQVDYEGAEAGDIIRSKA